MSREQIPLIQLLSFRLKGQCADLDMVVDIHSQLNVETAGMYMIMMCMLSAQLWGQIAEGMGRFAVEAAISRDLVIDAMLAKVIARSEGLARTIDATRCMLQQTG